ncbi:MAG: hypothetical protein GVY26_00965 [Bacteroidetes bacterium]|jgi:GNAT superfamily N-acetyltransferase|nr:hypothetical protein [Bacteroidota bacterium]
MSLPFYVEKHSFEQLYRLKEQRASILEGVQRVFHTLHANPEKKLPGYLHDEVKYQELIAVDYSDTSDFGYFFLLREKVNHQIVGFILAFDDLEGEARTESADVAAENKSRVFPLEHIARYLDHDSPFVKDLCLIGRFAFLFQIGILPDYQRSGGGQLLIHTFEETYHRAHVLAGSLHERQYYIFKLLLNMENEDNQYIFLDHYFDHHNEDQHWFRIVKPLSTKGFVRKIVNPQYLPQTYSTVIPIQLSRAVDMVNKIIEHMDAKVLWSSFFNASELLQKRYGMERDNHGFFNSLKEVKSHEDYRYILSKLRNITQYLRIKETQSQGVPSLTNAFTPHSSYQVFFLNDDPSKHDFHQFDRPVCFNIADEEKLLVELLKHDLLQRRSEYPKLGHEDKEAWYKTLVQVSKVRHGQTQNAYIINKAEEEWARWKELLFIDEETESVLLDGIAMVRQQIADEDMTQEQRAKKEQYEERSKSIKELRIIDEQERKKWRDYIHLHQLAYEVDQRVIEDPANYWWCHAIIPINHYGSGSVVGIMFAFRCRKVQGQEARKRMGNLASLISSSLSKNIFNILIKLQQIATAEASNRHFITAVTSRNLAHNFGSHILPHMDKPELLKQLMKWEFKGNFAEEMARFLHFLRVRAALLADISNNEPVSTSPQWLRQDLIRGFNEQQVIKRFLSNKIVKRIDVNYRVKGKLKQQDVEIQVPNGDLGASAFYMILENIIRNVIKYEKMDKLEVLKIAVDVIKEDKRGYHIAIYDNSLRKDNSLRALVKNIQSQYIQKGTTDTRKNSVSGRGWGIYEMRAAASYLRKKIPGISRVEKGDGFIPMLQSKRIRLPEDELRNKARQQMERAAQEASHSGRRAKASFTQTLAYYIYLKKPRTLLLVDISYQLSDRAVQEAEERKDMKLLRGVGFSKRPRQIHSHDFAVYFKPEDRVKLETSKRYPLRWILLDQQAEKDELEAILLGRGNKLDLMDWLWGKWIVRYMKHKGLVAEEVELFAQALDGARAPSYKAREHSGEMCIYDDHGEFSEANPEYPLDELLFYQQHRSTDSLGMAIQGKKKHSQVHRSIFKAELLEAAITNVIILDERLQRDILQRSTAGPSKNAFLKLLHMNIYLPDPRKEPDLYDRADKGALSRWLKRLIQQQRIDFIVIHLGILESWVSSDMKHIDQWLHNHIYSVDERPEVVFISGRGKPIGLPKRVSFQPYDSIAKHVLEHQPSKYHLTKILFSSRARTGL